MNEKILYVETTSDEAIDVIENLTLVGVARRLLDNSSLMYCEKGDIVQKLKELERTLRRDFRTKVLEPNPVRVSQHLINRIECEIMKEKT